MATHDKLTPVDDTSKRHSNSKQLKPGTRDAIEKSLEMN